MAFGKGPFGYMTSRWHVGAYADCRDGETGSHSNYLLSAKLVKVDSKVTRYRKCFLKICRKKTLF